MINRQCYSTIHALDDVKLMNKYFDEFCKKTDKLVVIHGENTTGKVGSTKMVGMEQFFIPFLEWNEKQAWGMCCWTTVFLMATLSIFLSESYVPFLHEKVNLCASLKYQLNISYIENQETTSFVCCISQTFLLKSGIIEKLNTCKAQLTVIISQLRRYSQLTV